YDLCEAQNKPMVMHVRTEPKSPAYLCDPYEICAADKLESVLKNFPGLKICVPHLGFGELIEYKELIEKYDTLWLDTAMVITDYFSLDGKIELKEYRLDRIMYGSDFPNIPYEWDRELNWISLEGLGHRQREWILHKNAEKFFHIIPK
ncbi:MAG: amidohydrolase family protein, partial [Desulfobacteraceae bacterium]|nr:amidohydrolase family protein [Desulfobacteraceae bacterium]